MPTPKWSTVVGTVFGAGYFPVAPGTVGALLALPVVILLANTALWIQITVAVAVTALGVLTADRIAADTGVPDPHEAVIDEFAGILITFIGVALNTWTVIVGFVLFRLFDIWKPGPIRWLDQNVRGGLGVMLDDVAAAILARLVLALLIVAF